MGALKVFRHYATYRRHFFKTFKKLQLLRFVKFSVDENRFPSLKGDVFGNFRSRGTDTIFSLPVERTTDFSLP